MSNKPKKADKPQDLAILRGPTEDGQGRQLLRLRDGQLSAGEIRPVKEGLPVNDKELVRLHPLEGHEGVCEVEVLHDSARAAQEPSREAQPGRPARVATERYRKNWSTIFDAKRKPRSGHPRDDWSVN